MSIKIPEGFFNQDQGSAWVAIWQWCRDNGLDEHSFENMERYKSLNAPEMIAQWITDLKEKNGTNS